MLRATKLRRRQFVRIAQFINEQWKTKWADPGIAMPNTEQLA